MSSCAVCALYSTQSSKPKNIGSWFATGTRRTRPNRARSPFESSNGTCFAQPVATRTRATHAMTPRRTSLTQHDESAAVCEYDHEQHRQQRQIVIPAEAFFAPEAGFPDEHFLLNRTERDQDQSDRGELLEHAQNNRDPAGELCRREKNRGAPGQADALAASIEVFQIFVAAVGIDQPDHDPHQQQPVVGQVLQVKHAYRPASNRACALFTSSM